jgi:hypothetical protein
MKGTNGEAERDIPLQPAVTTDMTDVMLGHLPVHASISRLDTGLLAHTTHRSPTFGDIHLMYFCRSSGKGHTKFLTLALSTILL